MMLFRNILFPIDFSERSYAAAPFIHALARFYDSRVILVHVCETGTPPFPASAYVTGVCYEAIESDSRKRLRKFADSQLPKLDTLCVASVGSPGEGNTIRSSDLQRRSDRDADAWLRRLPPPSARFRHGPYIARTESSCLDRCPCAGTFPPRTPPAAPNTGRGRSGRRERPHHRVRASIGARYER